MTKKKKKKIPIMYDQENQIFIFTTVPLTAKPLKKKKMFLYFLNFTLMCNAINNSITFFHV